MPQMAPMMWLIYEFYFILMLFFIVCLFFFLPYLSLSMKKKTFKSANMIWKW